MDQADDDHVEGLIRAGMTPDHKDKLKEGQLGGKLNQDRLTRLTGWHVFLQMIDFNLSTTSILLLVDAPTRFHTVQKKIQKGTNVDIAMIVHPPPPTVP